MRLGTQRRSDRKLAEDAGELAPLPRRLPVWRRLAICAIDFLVGNWDRLDADWKLREPWHRSD